MESLSKTSQTRTADLSPLSSAGPECKPSAEQIEEPSMKRKSSSAAGAQDEHSNPKSDLCQAGSNEAVCIPDMNENLSKKSSTLAAPASDDKIPPETGTDGTDNARSEPRPSLGDKVSSTQQVNKIADANSSLSALSSQKLKTSTVKSLAQQAKPLSQTETAVGAGKPLPTAIGTPVESTSPPGTATSSTANADGPAPADGAPATESVPAAESGVPEPEGAAPATEGVPAAESGVPEPEGGAPATEGVPAAESGVPEPEGGATATGDVPASGSEAPASENGAAAPDAASASGTTPLASRAASGKAPKQYKSSAQRLREKRKKWEAALRRDMQLLLSQQPTATQAVRCHLFLEVLPTCEEPLDPMAPGDRIRIENLLHDNVMIYREN